MSLNLHIGRPSRGQLDRYLERAERRPLTYHPSGLTDGPAPDGYRVFDRSIDVGRGSDGFERAARMLRSWGALDIPWVVLFPDCPVIRPGLTVVVAARTLGLWTLNPARVVEVIDQPGRFAFAYGTVDGHAASGEERFSVVLQENGTVVYRLTAYSKLRHPLARMAPPIARRVQQRFAAASLQAMRRALIDPD